MSAPQEMHIRFQHLGTDYNIDLVKGSPSEYSVKINGITYAVMGDQEKLEMACKILSSVSLESITNEQDLQGRLAVCGDISFPKSQKAEEIGVKVLNTAEKPLNIQEKLLEEAYTKLKKDLKEYAKENLREGALLVQVVGINGSKEPLVFGKRSVNDVIPVPVNENTIGRTGSGAKLWAGLLTNILTSKYGNYIQMNDDLGKFAPQEALKKFGRIGQGGRDQADPELAKEITVEGLIGMMAGLEYEQLSSRDPPLSSLDQFLRGPEINDGSIHILYQPQDKINFYTNNICFAAYPLEKAYKKILAAELIKEGKLNENETLLELAPQLDVFRNELQERIKKTEEDIYNIKQLGGAEDVIEPYEIRLAYMKTDLQKLTIPESAMKLKLKDLMACQTAYTPPPSSVYIYDFIDLFLMPSNNHRVDYAEIMKRELLGPLGMDNSGFRNVPGTHMDLTFKNTDTKEDESKFHPENHPLKFGAGYGRTCLTDASKLAKGLANPKGLIGKDGTILLTPKELDAFFKPHGHYSGWGLGGAELTCEGKVIDKGGSRDQDQYSFWVDRESGVGLIAMCNCGRRPDEILNAFKETVEHIRYPDAKRVTKEKEGSPLGISTDHYFAHPLVLKDVYQLFEGTRGRVALLFDYDTAEKGVIHWSGTPLEVEKKDGVFRVTTPGRFQGLNVQKIKGKKSGEEYLALGDTSFIAIKTDKLPSQTDIQRAEKEYSQLQGKYINHEHPEWGALEFKVEKNGAGNILLGAREGSKGDFVPQSIVQADTNSILFNGHDRQPPDKIFKFVRDSKDAPWRLQVLDYISKKFIEERPKSALR